MRRRSSMLALYRRCSCSRQASSRRPAWAASSSASSRSAAVKVRSPSRLPAMSSPGLSRVPGRRIMRRFWIPVRASRARWKRESVLTASLIMVDGLLAWGSEARSCRARRRRCSPCAPSMFTWTGCGAPSPSQPATSTCSTSSKSVTVSAIRPRISRVECPVVMWVAAVCRPASIRFCSSSRWPMCASTRAITNR